MFCAGGWTDGGGKEASGGRGFTHGPSKKEREKTNSNRANSPHAATTDWPGRALEPGTTRLSLQSMRRSSDEPSRTSLFFVVGTRVGIAWREGEWERRSDAVRVSPLPPFRWHHTQLTASGPGSRRWKSLLPGPGWWTASHCGGRHGFRLQEEEMETPDEGEGCVEQEEKKGGRQCAYVPAPATPARYPFRSRARQDRRSQGGHALAPAEGARASLPRLALHAQRRGDAPPPRRPHPLHIFCAPLTKPSTKVGSHTTMSSLFLPDASTTLTTR